MVGEERNRKKQMREKMSVNEGQIHLHCLVRHEIHLFFLFLSSPLSFSLLSLNFFKPNMPIDDLVSPCLLIIPIKIEIRPFRLKIRGMEIWNHYNYSYDPSNLQMVLSLSILLYVFGRKPLLSFLQLRLLRIQLLSTVFERVEDNNLKTWERASVNSTSRVAY